MITIATLTQSGVEPDADFKKLLEESGIVYVPRNRKSLAKLAAENDAEAIMVWQPGGPVLYHQKEKIFFHPSMAKVRLAAFRNLGVPDPMVKAMGLLEDDSVLDCTLGLGADAVAAAYFACKGRVVGLEVSLPVAYAVKWGMKKYCSEMLWLEQAVHRVEVHHADHLKYLRGLPDQSFDIVYFDPMFRKPLLSSQAISPLRRYACREPLKMEAVNEARRVARKRVVIKERKDSGEFERIGCQRVEGSEHNKIGFGIIEE